MKIAFVGISKDWLKLEKEGYVQKFIQYHLELPWYYSLYNNDVYIFSDGATSERFGFVHLNDSKLFNGFGKFDVVIHWRKWFEEFYQEGTINLINSQDHSYGSEWLTKFSKAKNENKIDGILCFPKWHRDQLESELIIAQKQYGFNAVDVEFIDGVTLGVDTEIYKPKQKNMFDMLWASDPGRGLQKAMELTLQLFQIDKKYKLHICYPDYVSGQINIPNHPAFVVHKNLNNGPELWELFNKCAFLPYTSNFREPSSRAHRQAMAAGCVVLYPEKMGTPSDLIQDGVDGVVAPIEKYKDAILDLSKNTSFEFFSKEARRSALKENWQVQAIRFNNVIGEMINEKK